MSKAKEILNEIGSDSTQARLRSALEAKGLFVKESGSGYLNVADIADRLGAHDSVDVEIKKSKVVVRDSGAGATVFSADDIDGIVEEILSEIKTIISDRETSKRNKEHQDTTKSQIRSALEKNGLDPDTDFRDMGFSVSHHSSDGKFSIETGVRLFDDPVEAIKAALEVNAVYAKYGAKTRYGRLSK